MSRSIDRYVHESQNSAAVDSRLRIRSVDALRGIVMIVMALDHVRDFFHADAMLFQPEDLVRTNSALFFTRWITHFCAPVFFFTAGMGAYFWLTKPGRTVQGLSRFLWTRGLWLMLLELTVVRFAFFFSLTSGPLLLTVLWGLGMAMVAMAVLCRVPIRWLAPLSVAVIALHNTTDRINAADLGVFAFVWNVLHQVGVFVAGGIPIIVTYPLIPWFAVMSAGYCFAPLLLLEPERRRRVVLLIGTAVTVGFVAVRALNLYGDPAPWTTAIPDKTILSFLRTTKYPPSLLFLLMTLGPALALLSWLDRLPLPRTNPLVLIGRVPLFFFLVHFALAHALTLPFAFVRYGEVSFLLQPLPSLGGSRQVYPADFGYDLVTVYIVWLLVVALVYPLCVWFGRIKERRTDSWLSYF